MARCIAKYESGRKKGQRCTYKANTVYNTCKRHIRQGKRLSVAPTSGPTMDEPTMEDEWADMPPLKPAPPRQDEWVDMPPLKPAPRRQDSMPRRPPPPVPPQRQDSVPKRPPPPVPPRKKRTVPKRRDRPAPPISMAPRIPDTPDKPAWVRRPAPRRRPDPAVYRPPSVRAKKVLPQLKNPERGDVAFWRDKRKLRIGFYLDQVQGGHLLYVTGAKVIVPAGAAHYYRIMGKASDPEKPAHTIRVLLDKANVTQVRRRNVRSCEREGDTKWLNRTEKRLHTFVATLSDGEKYGEVEFVANIVGSALLETGHFALWNFTVNGRYCSAKEIEAALQKMVYKSYADHVKRCGALRIV